MKTIEGISHCGTLIALHRVQPIVKPLSLAVMSLVIATVLTSHANAQTVCPTPTVLTNGVTGTTTWWAFLTEDGSQGDAQVGVFAATVLPANPPANPFPRGVLVGTQSSNNGGVITQRAGFSGVFTSDTLDCARGTISFNINGNAYQYTYILADTFPSTEIITLGGGSFFVVGTLSSTTKLLMVSSNTNVPNNSFGPFAGNRGTAYLLPGPPACTNPADPLAQLLVGQPANVGSNWSLLGRDYESANSAMFSATESTSPFPRGNLKGIQTVSGSYFGVQSIGGTFTGTYTVFGADPNLPATSPASCEGGQLFISGNGTSYQYDFVFAPPFDANGPTRLLGVTTSNDVPNATGTSFRGNYMEAYRNFPH